MEPRRLTQAQSAYLDFLRAAAAMTVLFGHASIMFANGGFLYNLNLQAGGVIVFFLMSGFLISYSVFSRWNNPDYGFREFFLDRFFRIYTAFLPALVFVFIIDYFFTTQLNQNIEINNPKILEDVINMHTNNGLVVWLGNLLMLNNFPIFQVLRTAGIESSLFIDEYGSAAPFWTICIEWWIYIVFGMVTLIFIRNPNKIKKPLILLIFGFAFITPFYYLLGGPIDHLSFLWIFGMVAAYIFVNMPSWAIYKKVSISKSQKMLIPLCVFAFSCLCILGRLASLISDSNRDSVDFNFAELQFSIFLTLAIFSLLFFFGTFQKAPVMLVRIFKFFAGYSFSLYLTHMTIVLYIYIAYSGNDNSNEAFWTAIIISNIVAIIFWWLFERHYTKLAKWAKVKFKKKAAI